MNVSLGSGGFLEDIFTNESNHFVAISTHLYAISAILTILGLRHFRIRESCSITVFLKGEKLGSLNVFD